MRRLRVFLYYTIYFVLTLLFLSHLHVILGFKWGYYLVLSSFTHRHRYRRHQSGEGMEKWKKVEAAGTTEMAARFRIVYFCQVLFVRFYLSFFLFGGSPSFGDSMKGLSVCLSVGIDVSLFNWKIIFFLRFIYSSFLFFYQS